MHGRHTSRIDRAPLRQIAFAARFGAERACRTVGRLKPAEKRIDKAAMTHVRGAPA
jgi:hypothetical protein